MKKTPLLWRIIYWIDEKLSRYNCAKNRHRWCYTLSESGTVYMNDKDVPPELWHCIECQCRKYTTEELLELESK